MKSVCKAFVIVENEECVQSKAFVEELWLLLVENEDCVQSFCNCGE